MVPLFAVFGLMIALCAALTGASNAAAPAQRVFYVSTRGSDHASGSAKAPWRTVQYAVDHATSGSTISISAGHFDAFVVRRPSLHLKGAGVGRTVIVGNAKLRDVVQIAADRVIVDSMDISSCVPKVVAGDGMENDGASGVAITSAGSWSQVVHSRIIGITRYNQYGLNFGCFGIAIRDAGHVLVAGDEITGGGYGVFVRHGGAGNIIRSNRIHDIHAMIRNTPKAGDDFGGSAVGFNQTTTSSTVSVYSNQIYNNVAYSSHDYGTDGGGFDLYGSSGASIHDNLIYNNENVLESGNGPGGQCLHDYFFDNNVYGRTPGSKLKHSIGMIMRCGKGMVVTGNVFRNIDWWTFDITPQDGDTGQIDGMRIQHNNVTQRMDIVWAIERPRGSAHYYFEPNTYSYQGYFAENWDHQMQRTQSQFQADIA